MRLRINDMTNLRHTTCALAAVIAGSLLLTGCASPLADYEAEVRQSAQPHAQIQNPDWPIVVNSIGDSDVGVNSSNPAAQSPTLHEESSLADCLRFAALHNAELAASFYHWRAAVEKSPQVTALPDPKFTYGYFINEVETRVGAQQQQVQLAQTFPWFGKLDLQGQAADANARAAYQIYESKKTALFHRVRTSYYELYYLRQVIATTNENFELLQQFQEIALQKYRVGQTSQADVIRIEVELGKLEDHLRRLNAQRSPLTAQLNAALNQPAAAPAPWPHEIPDTQLNATEAELLLWMRASNPELRTLDEAQTEAQLKTAVAQKAFYPDITLGLMYTLTDDAMDPTIPESGDDATLASITINLPIQKQKYAASVRAAIANRLSIAKSKEEKINQLDAAITQAVFQHDDAHRRITLYRDTLIPKALESLEASMAAFEGGQGRFLDLIDTERTLLEFQLLQERARTDRVIALSKLERLVGRSLPTADSDHRNSTPEVSP